MFFCNNVQFTLQVYLEGNRIFDYKSGSYRENYPIRVSVHDPMSVANLDQAQWVAKVVTGHERFQKKPINPSFFNSYGII